MKIVKPPGKFFPVSSSRLIGQVKNKGPTGPNLVVDQMIEQVRTAKASIEMLAERGADYEAVLEENSFAAKAQISDVEKAVHLSKHLHLNIQRDVLDALDSHHIDKDNGKELLK